MKIVKILSPNEGDLTGLNNNFWNYISSRIPDLPAESEDKKFLFSAFEESKFIGGISGNVYWNGLEIDTL